MRCTGRRGRWWPRVVAAGALAAAAVLPATVGAAPAQASASQLASAVSSYLATRPGIASVAVYDLDANRSWSYNGTTHGYTASIVKVATVAALLHRHGYPLTSYESSLATRALEHSDNDAETALCKLVGGESAMQAFYDLIGMSHTTAKPCLYGGTIWWGHTRTTAPDQVVLLKRIAVGNPYLSWRSRHYLRYLMSHVESDQRWGVSAGVPTGVTVDLKDGWRPVPERSGWWQMNSIGYVHGDGKRYLIAVLTQSPPVYSGGTWIGAEDVGISTIAGVSRRAWRYATTG